MRFNPGTEFPKRAIHVFALRERNGEYARFSFEIESVKISDLVSE